MPKKKTDTYLGEDPEITEAKEAADQKALEKKLDSESSASENEVQLLKEQLAEERAKREKYEANREKYLRGDWKDLPNDHPFLVTIHKEADVAKNFDVPVTVNGKRIVIKRGVPTEIPKSHVLVLKECKYKHVIQLANPETGKREHMIEDRNRFQYDAHPIGV